MTQLSSAQPYPSNALSSLPNDWMEQQNTAFDKHCIISIINKNGIIEYVNENFTDVCGYHPEDIIGKSYTLLSSGLHEAPFYTDIFNVIAKDNQWHGEICNKRKDGKHYWLEATIFPIRNTNDQITHYVEVSNEITDKHSTLQAMRKLYAITSDESNSFSQKVGQILELGQIIFGLPSGVIAHVNDNNYIIDYCVSDGNDLTENMVIPFKNTYCYHMLKKSLPLAIHEVKNSDLSNEACYQEYQLEAYIGCPIKCSDGQHSMICFSGPIARHKPFTAVELEVIQLFATWISDEMAKIKRKDELIRQQQLLTSVSKQAKMGAWEYNVASNSIYLNDVSKNVFSINVDAVLNIEDFYNFFIPAEKNKIKKVINDAIASKKPWYEESQIINGIGKHIWIAFRGETITDNEGKIKLFGSIQNISSKKENDAKQVEQNNRLQLLLDSTNVGIWDWDITNDLLHYDQSWLELFNQESNSHTLSLSDRIMMCHPADIKSFKDKLNEHLNKISTIFTVQTRIKNQNGEWTWCIDTGKIIEWDNGKPKRMIGTTLDINETKLAEEKLSENHQRMKLAQTAAGIGTWEYNVENEYLEWDTQMHILYGTAKSNNFNNCFNDWASRLHPEDKERAIRELDSATKNGKSFDTEFRIIGDDLVTRCIRAAATTVFDKDGIAQKVIGVNYDISQLKSFEIENRQTLSLLSAIIESTDYGLLAVNRFGGIEKINSSLNKMFSLPDTESLRNSIALIQHISMFFSDSTKVYNILCENHTDDSDTPIIEAQTKDSRIFELFFKKIIISDNNQAKLWFFRDITEQRKSEAALLNAKILAEEATKTKSEFLASMSHEIRTPMNGILGMLNLLQTSTLPEEQNQRVTIAKNSANSLLTLLNDILDISKMEAQKLQLEKIPFELESFIDDFTDSVSSLIQNKGLDFNLNRPIGTQHELLGDPNRIRQILNNIVGNAIKFSPKGSITLDVQLININSDKVLLLLEVIDTGIGMETSAIENLFEAFSQVDSSTTRRFGGSGLGLAIVKNLVTLMNGSIQVESAINKGSSFKITLELNKQRNSETKKEFSHNLNGRNVILLSSSKQNTQNHLRLLEALNLNCTEQYDIDEYIQLANGISTNPDLIICEIKSNVQFENILNFAPMKKIPTIIISNNHTTDKLYIDQNKLRVLYKPLTPTRLADNIINIISNREVPTTDNRNLNFEKFNHEKILLVEDNQINQLVAKQILESWNLSVDVVNNGREAISALEYSDPSSYQIILMDCQMPIMDGYEASRYIRNDNALVTIKNIPIIAMTAHAMAGDRERCIVAGMDDYISKPIEPRTLHKLLAKYLEYKPDPNKQDDRNFKEEQTISNHDIWMKKEALERLFFNNELLSELVTIFTNDLPSKISELDTHLHDRDYLMLMRKAHALKGMAANLSAIEISELAKKIEIICRNDAIDLTEEVSQDNKNISESIAQLIDNLRKAEERFILEVNRTRAD